MKSSKDNEFSVTAANAGRASGRGEQYHTAGGGSNRWTLTSMMQLDQTSDGSE